MDYLKKYNEWLTNPYFDSTTQDELAAIASNDAEIKERFIKELEFGTGGLRGVIGAGTNRINIYTVNKATQGLANYILKSSDYSPGMGVAIAYDSRNMSPEFAKSAALVLAANGIKVHLFESLRPTPMLSFAIRHLGCISGIVITASHNPPEYNGYKAYWKDGSQLAYPVDERVLEEVNAVSDYTTIKTMSEEDAAKQGLLNMIGQEVDDAYIEAVKQQSLNADAVKQQADDFCIVYTPLHGTGNLPVRRILKEVGFTNVNIVSQQELPDANFTTVASPNPEEPKAFTLALELANKLNADIVIATDPDADRLGVIVRHNGKYIMLNGNMTGVLLAEYVISQKQKQGVLPQNAAVVSTIVSTNMTKTICEHYNVRYEEVLTGFKYIGERIKAYEESGEAQYVHGFEESYGALSGTHARDKDAVCATMLICEMAAYYKAQGKTLCDVLEDMYKKYGYYSEGLKSVTLKGLDGAEQIKKIMQRMRTEAPTEVSGIAINKIYDYKEGIIKNVVTGEVSKTALPKSDVLYFEMTEDNWFCVRPSGTEPKIKLYFGVKKNSADEAEKALKRLTKDVEEIILNAPIKV